MWPKLLISQQLPQTSPQTVNESFFNSERWMVAAECLGQHLSGTGSMEIQHRRNTGLDISFCKQVGVIHANYR